MYMCLCCAMNESRINALLQPDIKSVKDLRKKVRIATGCGSCIPSLNNMIRSYHMDQLTEFKSQLEKLNDEYDYFAHERECIEFKLKILDEAICRLEHKIDNYDEFLKDQKIEDELDADE